MRGCRNDMTGTDHQIKRDAEHRVIYPSHVIEKLWNKYLGSSVQYLIVFIKENTF